MAKFQILRMETIGTPPFIQDGRPMMFADPAQAAAYAKIVSKQTGEKMCVKPVVDEAWRERENTRFLNMEYRVLPWHASRWWTDAYPIWKDHFPHASLEKPGWIAYTKSVEDGVKDKQSLLRPGAYLSRYFEKHMHDYGISNRNCVESFMKMYGPIDIKFAVTEDEIVKVYNNGPRTCLNEDKQWPNDIHPATVYAAGDLQIAYLGNMDGKVSARTLVWPEKKLHSRVYGDIARLTQGLTRLGYKWGPPIGARLKRIELRKPRLDGYHTIEGCFLLPYIDKKNQQGGGHLSVIDKDDHLVICADGTPGSHPAKLADGLSGPYVPREDEHPRFECYKCGADDCQQVIEVFVDAPDDDGENAEHESWCHDCVAEYAWRCHWSDNHYANRVPSVAVSGQPWLEMYATMYAVRCEATGKLCCQNDVLEIRYPDGSEKTLSKDYTRKIGGSFQSGLTGYNYLRDERRTVSTRVGDTHWCAKSELTRHAFQCDSCDEHWTIGHRFQPRDDDLLLCPICMDNFRYNKVPPISMRRKKFEDARNQVVLPLIAAE